MAELITQTDFDDLCRFCGDVLPQDRYASMRQYCGPRCYNAEYHGMEAAALLEAKRDRPPCAHCGGTVSPEKFGHAKYCSAICRRRAGMARTCAQNPKTCPHCGCSFLAHTSKQVYCSHRCFGEAVQRKHQPRLCMHCGQMIQRPGKASQRYCSLSCSVTALEAAKRQQLGGRQRLTRKRLDAMLERLARAA